MFTDRPTHYPENGGTPTTIDIVVNKNVKNISELTALNELSSDHRPIKFEIGQMESNESLEAYNYKKIDWSRFRDILNANVIINNKINTKQCLDQEILKLTNNIELALNEITNKVKIKRKEEELPEDIINKIKQRNRTRRIWQKTRDPVHKISYKRQTETIREEITAYRNTIWTQKLSKINIYDKSLWKTTKIFRRKLQLIPTLEVNNSEAFTDKDKAEMIATQYEEVHSIDLTNNDAKQEEIIKSIKEFADKRGDQNCDINELK